MKSISSLCYIPLETGASTMNLHRDLSLAYLTILYEQLYSAIYQSQEEVTFCIQIKYGIASATCHCDVMVEVSI